MKKLLIFGVLAPCLSLIWIAIFVIYLSMKPYSGPDKEFVIKPGEAFSKINYRLNEEKIITTPRLFHKMSQYKGVMEKFKPGTYTIKSGSTMTEIMNLFVKGSQVFVKLTIAEGKNLFEIAEEVAELDLDTKEEFIRKAKSKEFAEKLGISADRIEGYLFPDTYVLEPHMDSEAIIKMMVSNFNKRTSELLKTPHPTLTPHEVVILASMVEKETGAAFERPIIAGVFLNRLKKRMRLQSDPTTIYGIYENFNGNLRKKHLLEKTPYNTYKIPALPKGPIANPGVEAIEAVYNPENHDYLYFVSKNDGTHIFTKNYKDHLKAVEEWQKNRNNRKGKSWRDLDKSKRANQ